MREAEVNYNTWFSKSTTSNLKRGHCEINRKRVRGKGAKVVPSSRLRARYFSMM